MEQCFEHHATQSESNHDGIDKLKTASAGGTGSENNSGGFDCNICLDFVQDPVVTFCGHLYCWPCIYRWLHSQETSSEDPQCPVCKADVTQNTLVPLYGRTQSGKPSDSKGTQIGLVIPQRPNSCGIQTLVAGTSTTSRPHSHPREQLHHHEVHPYYSLGDYSPSPAFGFAGTTTFHPMIGMFGEMIYGRFFGNSQATLYTYPNTHRDVGISTSSGRLRRHVMQADRSLSRVSFFLFCCIILCLLLF
ncbi:E3 ubiquitin-protein ligase RMA1H1-like [Silene latifolia]|uniref:E3 ubiquitin-protein ligase RMA1H1-like n=1 Tax=Silene latifolia TaxID=37657 RepID=UPI003D784549